MSNGFVDKVTISVKAGRGGDGAVTFHREKFVAAGGPDGGDGGRGGDIVLVVDDQMSTLMDFRYKRKFTAGNGQNGQNKRCSGKDGETVTIKVPRGTLVRDRETGGIMADMLSAIALLSAMVYVFRGSKIILSTQFSIFYWVLYLCALEFLPICVVVNFLINGN